MAGGLAEAAQALVRAAWSLQQQPQPAGDSRWLSLAPGPQAPWQSDAPVAWQQGPPAPWQQAMQQGFAHGSQPLLQLLPPVEQPPRALELGVSPLQQASEPAAAAQQAAPAAKVQAGGSTVAKAAAAKPGGGAKKAAAAKAAGDGTLPFQSRARQPSLIGHATPCPPQRLASAPQRGTIERNGASREREKRDEKRNRR